MGNGIGHGRGLVVIAGTFHLDGDELGCAFTIAHDGLGQLHGGLDQRLQQFGCPRIVVTGNAHRPLAGTEQQEGVIGGRVAIHGNAVEAGVSHATYPGLQQVGGNSCIGGNHAQHGGHVGTDHAGALGNAGHHHLAAGQLHAARYGLGQRVGRHDGLGRLRPVRGRQIGHGLRHAGRDALDRQMLQDHAGGHGQHGIGRHAQCGSHGLTDLLCVALPFGTGAGIGHAGVHDQRPHLSLRSRQMLARHHHRGCTETVAGKDPRHLGTLGQTHHQQVAPARFADACTGGTQFHAGYGQQAGGIGSGQIDGHGVFLVVGSRPVQQKTGFPRPRLTASHRTLHGLQREAA